MNMINGSKSETGGRDLADALMARGLLTADAARLVRREAERLPGGSLLRAIEHMGLVDEADLVAVLAAESGLAAWPGHPVPADPAGLSAEMLVTAGAVPLGVERGELLLAMIDPDDLTAAETIRRRLGHAGQLRRMVIGRTAFARLIGRLHRNDPMIDAMIAAAAGSGATPGLTIAAEHMPEDPFRDRPSADAEESAVTRLADMLIAAAVRAGASDLHLDPAPGHLGIRLRIDGVLTPFRLLDAAIASGLVTRFKVMAGLDAVVTLRPQDGRITSKIDGLAVEIRIATHPTVHGEAVVLRLLDADRRLRQLEGLGLTSRIVEGLRHIARRPDGIVVVAGPTGSGKSTTLRALTGLIDRRRLAVATLEDPVEYPLDGIRQTDLSRLPELSFADGIRSLMRQDPDVLLIGEMRDETTAAMAYRAAVTGHRVYTTLHAGDALGTIDRLRDLGLAPRRLAGVLAAILVQRLVRRLCPDCSPGPGIVGSGCPACGFTGFRGRIPVAELLIPDDAFEDLLAGDAARPHLAAHLSRCGHHSLLADAREIERRGLSTRDEIEAVVGPLDRP
jgi:general secretion pathway protein E/type IV pilus assembly protein PilB